MTTQKHRLEQFKKNAPEVYGKHLLRRVPEIKRRISELGYKMAIAKRGPHASTELEWMGAEIAGLEEELALLTNMDKQLTLDTESAQEAKPIL